MEALFAPGPVVLAGNHARLEPLRFDHAPGLLEAAQDDLIWRYMPCPRPRSEGEVRGMVAEALEAQEKGLAVPFAIIDTGYREGGERVAGSTRYLDIVREDRRLEIGWTWLGVPWQRTPVNTECKYLLLRNAFEKWGALRVQLRTDARNERSQRAILRIGASFEGRFRKHRVMHDGYVRDSMFYSVIAEDWPAVKARLEGMVARGSPEQPSR